MYKHEFSNHDDMIDSRDIEKRIEDLEDERDKFEEDNELSPYVGEGMNEDEKWDEWEDSGDAEELKILKSLQDQGTGYGFGSETLIRDSYFVEYCEELVKDIGDLPDDLPGYIEANINWEGVANDLQADYTSLDYDGVTYWMRSS